MAIAATIIVLTAFLISAVLTARMRSWAPRLGLVDEPEGGRKDHGRTMPLGGGLAMIAAVFLTVLLGVLAEFAMRRFTTLHSLPHELYDVLWSRLPIAAAVLGGGLVIAIAGLVDDLRELGPWSKLAVQTAVAVLLVVCGVRAGIPEGHTIVASVITVLWIVGITNAFNLLDNMDGLSAGVAFIISLIFFIVAVQAYQYFVAAFLLTIMGATGGFLLFNFPPASIFMGDAGSLFIGYLLAVSAVIFSASYRPSYPLFSLTVPVLVFAVPLFDTTSVMIVRMRKGRSPFAADKSHFSHRLVAIGMTPRKAVFTNYLMTFCTGIAATLLYQTNTLGAVTVFVQLLAVIAIIVLLETAGQRLGRE